MNSTITLREATIQEIQLELIRRTKFNTFDGEKVCEILARYRGHWQAVLLDRPGVPNYNQPGSLLVSGLIKLRDLEDNIWNSDTLYVLTHTIDQAMELGNGFDEAEIGAMPQVHDDMAQTDMALGTGRQVYGLLTVWWD